MTYGWTSDYRANLLATHLIGPAKLTYESLSPDQRQDYDTIKAYITNSNANTEYIRAKAHNDVMSGIRPRSNENILDYGLRVLKTIRDSMLPNTPEDVVEDIAKGHLRYINDSMIHSSLAIQKSQLSFYELIDHAAMLRSMNASKPG